MKIRFVKEMRSAILGDQSVHFEQDGCSGALAAHLDRRAAIAVGFTDKELDRAEAAPGTWIECEREEGANDTSDWHPIDAKVADLTEQRDRLLETCKSTLPHLRHYYQLCPCEAVSLDIGSLVSAIATAKPGESK